LEEGIGVLLSEMLDNVVGKRDQLAGILGGVERMAGMI
jgi:hypothetical protein